MSPTTSLTNKAAYLSSSSQLAILPAPNPSPSTLAPHQLLIRNRAIGLNFIDGLKQRIPTFVFPWTPFPWIGGSDVCGDVLAVGPGITRFKVGDRVVGHAMGCNKQVADAAADAARTAGTDKAKERERLVNQEGAFQGLVILRESFCAKLPSPLLTPSPSSASGGEQGGPEISYADAAVLPLALCTAACGLFPPDQLALDKPRVTTAHDATSANSRNGGSNANGKILLIWGASTSVGNCAVQLASAAGYRIIATASPSNWDAVRKLGRGKVVGVFDYRDSGVVQHVTDALQQQLTEGNEIVGALAIGERSLGLCAEVLGRLSSSSPQGSNGHKGKLRKFIASVSMDLPSGGPADGGGMASLPWFLARMVWMNLNMWMKLRRLGVESRFVEANSLFDWGQEDGGMLYKFVEEGLQTGEFVPSPRAKVVGNRLEMIQQGLEITMKGMRAEKAVVTLGE